ncbi:unnamed protein product [Jaminaea pallidilutea]
MGAQGSKPPKITSHDRAILDLKVARDKIRIYSKKLILIEQKEKEAAQALLARGEKQRALSALRRAKYQRSMLDKTDGQLRTLEELVSNIEFSQIQASVYHGLEQGNAVLKEIHKELNPESVDRLMEQTSEAQAYQREVDEMLASKMTAEEEEEVQREMEKLEEQASGVVAGETNRPQQQQQQQQPVPTLPDAPTAQPVRPVEEQKPQREQKRSEEERQPVLA